MSIIPYKSPFCGIKTFVTLRSSIKIVIVRTNVVTLLLLGRPTYLSADLGFAAILSIFFFFFRHLPSELAEWNSTKIGHMLGSKCDFKMHVRNVGTSPLPANRGSKTTFSVTSQLNGNFNDLYLPNETRHRQSGKCIDNCRGLLHHFKMS